MEMSPCNLSLLFYKLLLLFGGAQPFLLSRVFLTFWRLSWAESPSLQLPSRGIFTDRDNVKEVHFYVYQDFNNPYTYEELIPSQVTPNSPPTPSWRKDLPTKVIVHGFVQNVNATFPQNVKNAYLKRTKLSGKRQLYNLMVVDWGRLAYQIEDGVLIYTRAVTNVEKVGIYLGSVLSLLVSTGHIEDLGKVHLVGQSLGAHVVGQAGSFLGGRVGRLSGLDPAGPLFYTSLKSRRLRTDDAAFTDVYHCNEGILGTTEEIGKVQFYPNYDGFTHVQPQCLRPLRKDAEPEGWNLCSHNYCPKFFALSILERRKAVDCDRVRVVPRGCDLTKNGVTFGEDLEVAERPEGKYYLKIQEDLDSMSLFEP